LYERRGRNTIDLLSADENWGVTWYNKTNHKHPAKGYSKNGPYERGGILITGYRRLQFGRKLEGYYYLVVLRSKFSDILLRMAAKIGLVET
jgi:hypothetical protein